MWEDMAGLKPRRDLISFGFRKMWGAVWGGGGCAQGNGLESRREVGATKRGSFSVQGGGVHQAWRLVGRQV